MATLNYKPDWSASGEHNPSINKVSFGDGYSQRGSNGLNADMATWDVKFTRSPEEIKLISDFLKARANVEAFNWVDPFGTNITVVTDGGWKVTIDSIGWHTLTAKFVQVPETVAA